MSDTTQEEVTQTDPELEENFNTQDEQKRKKEKIGTSVRLTERSKWN